MGISDIEILGPDDEDDEHREHGEHDEETGDASHASHVRRSSHGRHSSDGSHGRNYNYYYSDTATGPGSGNGFGPNSSRPWRRLFHPPNAPVIASLLAVVLVVAAAAFAAVQKNRSGNDFGVSLISAQYIVRQDAAGIDLTLALENTGSTMIELTGVSVYQSGLVRLTQTGDAAGVTETEAGAATASALGPGTAIASTALTPKDVEVVTVPFRYDCAVSALPPVSHSVSLAGFSARGTARTAQLTLPSGATPWQGGSTVRSALCSAPTPQANVALHYGGQTSTAITGTTAPTPTGTTAAAAAAQSPPTGTPRYTYTATLTASGPSPVTISSISQDNPGIATLVAPPLPITLTTARKSVNLTITWYVSNCVIATSAHSADGVKITASARQTVQTWDATLGGRFTTDLASGISTACSGG